MYFMRNVLGITLSALATALMTISLPAIGSPGTIKWQANLDLLLPSCASSPLGSNLLSAPAVGPTGTIYTAGFAINPDGSLAGCFPISPTANNANAVAGNGSVYVPGSNRFGEYNSDGSPPGPLLNYPSGNFQMTPAVRSDGIAYALYVAPGFNCTIIGWDDAADPDGFLGTIHSTYASQNWDVCQSSPVVGHDGTIYLFSNADQQLVAFDPVAGTEKWRYATTTLGPLALDAQDTIYAATATGLVAIGSNGVLAWSFPLQFGNWNAPPVFGSDGTIYVSDGPLLKAITPPGQLKWTFSGAHCNPIVGQGDVIYCTGDAVYAINSSGTQLWSIALGTGLNSMNVHSALAPDGTLYTGNTTARVLYAIETGSLGLASSPWPKWRHDNRNSGLAGGGSTGGGADKVPNKTRGKCDPDNASFEGNPCNVATGNKFQTEMDYESAGPSALRYVRYYNSDVGTVASFLGPQWRGEFDRRLVFSSSGPARAFLNKNDGKIIAYDTSGSTIVPIDADTVERLVKIDALNWQLTAADDSVESYRIGGDGNNSYAALVSIKSRGGVIQTLSYATDGTMSSVIDSFGRSLTFTYDAQKRVSTMTDRAGNIFGYQYNAAGYLSIVTYPDNTPGNSADNPTRQYRYDDPANIGALTSIVDEAGNTFASWTYDGSRRATLSQHAGGAEQVTFTYNSNGTTTVNDAAGGSRNYTFSIIQNVPKATGITQGGFSKTASYDANGFPLSRVDRNGNTTDYQFNSRGLEASRTEAFGTAKARTITTTWNPNFRVPATITEPNRTIGFTYDSAGNALTKTITDTATSSARTWTYTYNSFGQVLTIDGPRTDATDLTTYTYYSCGTGFQCGQINTITNAASQVLTFNTYSAHGLPLTMTDPNGVITTLSYDARQRLVSRQMGSESTAYEYWPTGLLKKVTLPDTSFVQYTYDVAHRLTDITDSLGNKIHYALDNMGNRTGESTYDPSNFLHRTHTRTFNTLNQLYQDVNAAGTAAVTTTFGYDAQGNQTTANAPLTRNTTNAFDELNRLKQITDPGTGITQFQYDGNDNLTQVTDPRTLITTYQYNGFGNLKQKTSPDTGTTLNTYDSGGNLKTSTDARSKVGTYSYDALNRVTQLVYTDQTILFGYDAGTNGKGHLTSASDANHAMSWAYDGLGRVTGKGQTVGSVTKSVGYGYSSGNLATMTLPSGQIVTYQYNTNHQVTGITLGTGTPTTILSGATYEPLGPVKGWTWGNSTAVTRSFDTDGKISQIATTGINVTNTYQFDDAFHITGITDTGTSANSWTYGYDSRDRITSGSKTGTTRGWSYDPNGNRLTETGGAASTYTVSGTSNRISSTTGSLARTYGYDAAGNVLTYATITATYNNRGRMKTLKKGTVTETRIYNALGQMVQTAGGAMGAELFMYDEAGHLIGEYSSSGTLVQETIWMGDIPVATIRPKTGGVDIFYVHTDHLNTPRRVSRPSDNKLRWTWLSDPFGTDVANENPAAVGTFKYNLRFPGQIADSQAGLNQNTFRDYDSAIGRYVESDPIGFAAGINTYAYTGDSPVNRYDSLGLSWGSNWNYFWDWSLGAGEANRNYGQGELETREMQASIAAQKMRDAFIQSRCYGVKNFTYGTFEAYWDTTANPLTLDWSSTAFEVGGFAGGSVISNGDGTATFHFRNVSGTHSFWLHLVPDRTSPTGSMRNIDQQFTWKENIPACNCQK
jgi:RHS repeat-associated protein